MTDDARIVLRSRLGGWGRAAGMLFILAGTALVVVLLSDGLDTGRTLTTGIVLLVVGIVVVGVGLLMVLGHVEQVIDRPRRRIVTRRGVFGVSWTREMRLGENAHVQVFRARLAGSAEGGGSEWRRYVVFLQTERGRTQLLERDDHDEARAQGQRFADFLGIPLVDATIRSVEAPR